MEPVQIQTIPGGKTHEFLFTGRELVGFDVTSSVPFKCELWQEHDNRPITTCFGSSYSSVLWRTPHTNYLLSGPWILRVGNFDSFHIADFYVTPHVT